MLDIFNPDGVASGQSSANPLEPGASAPVQDLSWLVAALQLRNQIVPVALDSKPVAATVDVLQDGWGLAKFAPVIRVLQTAAPAVNAVDIAVPSRNTASVTALAAQQTIIGGGQLAVEMALILYTGKTSINAAPGHLIGIPISIFSVPPNDATGFPAVSWAAIMGRGDAVLVAPPGWGVAVTWNNPTTPPGYAVSVLAQVAAIPGQQRAR